MFRAAAPSLSLTLSRISHAARAALVCTTAAALLVGCGGGDRAEEYRPDRIVVFGDENSAFADDEAVGTGKVEALVYTVNPVIRGLDYCDDLVPLTVCPTPPPNTPPAGTYGADFVADDHTKPFGDGTFVAPVPPETNANFIRFIAIGQVTFTPTAGTATPNTAAKQDLGALYNCAGSVTAVQRIAHTFDKGFSGETQCPLESMSGAKTYAQPGATIATLQARVNLAKAEGQLGKGSLVTVWIGQNDIIEVATSGTYGTLDAKRLEIKLRADRLAQVVKQILDTGSKVVVIGVADLGYSPWAAALVPAVDVKSLVLDFNRTLKLGDESAGVKGLQDYTFRGRDYTFVDAGEISRAYVSNTSFVNDSVCATPAHANIDAPVLADRIFPTVKPDGTIVPAGGVFPVQYCTTLTTRGNVNTYLWASDRYLGWPIHEAIAHTALSRAINQF